MADLQIFTHPKSKASKAAERFFKERGLAFHAVDVRKKPPSPGELRKFVQKFGVDAVIDKTSKPWVEDGLRYFQAGEEDWIARLCETPTLINLPLVRCKTQLAVGHCPEIWQNFVTILRS